MFGFLVLVFYELPFVFLFIQFLHCILLPSKCLPPLFLLLTVVAIIALNLFPNSLQHRVIATQISINNA